MKEAGFEHVPRTQPLRGDLRKDAKSVVPLADRAIGNLQQWLLGTHHGVSRDQLQVYLDAFVFRHNRRKTLAVARYTVCMRRTNLVLDEHLLKEATRVLGARIYSAAVNTALAEVIRLKKIQSLSSFFGSGIWEGDLADMREDRPREKPRRSPRKPRRFRAQAK